jgi:hypothetical protein
MLTSILLLFTGLMHAPATPSDTTGWKSLESNKYDAKYPTTWQAETYENATLEFSITSAPEDEDDNYSEFVSLAALPLPGLNKTLDSYVNEFVKDIPFTYKKSVITKNEKATKAGKACYVLEYAGVINEFPVAYLQYIWFEYDVCYTLSYTAQQGSYERFKEKAVLIMDSFTFKQ